MGASTNVTLTARVLSNGVPLSGRSVDFALMKGSGTLSSSTVKTDSNGYAATNLQLSALAGDVQVSACVAPTDSPCQTFYGTAVPASGLQLQPVAGTSQMVHGQPLQPVVVRVTDLSAPPNPVLGAAVLLNYIVGEIPAGSTILSGGDTTTTRNPMPVILDSVEISATSDASGLASLQPTTAGFTGALEVLGTASAGQSMVPFTLQVLP
jgi:Bacterial Ig-like domain (group 1)